MDKNLFKKTCKKCDFLFTMKIYTVKIPPNINF